MTTVCIEVAVYSDESEDDLLQTRCLYKVSDGRRCFQDLSGITFPLFCVPSKGNHCKPLSFNTLSVTEGWKELAHGDAR